MSWLYQSAAHRFIRNPNVQSNIFKRAWTRRTPYENTMEVLDCPKTGKRVYLIGTTNSSTVLALRTQALIKDVQPDSLHVNTNEVWYNRVKDLRIDNQEQLNRVNYMFNDILITRLKDYPNNARGLYFKMRIFAWLWYMNYYLSFPADFNPWRPGLESLLAIKTAEQQGAKINFYGGMFNKHITENFAGENNIGLLRAFWSSLKGSDVSHWRREALDFWNVLRTKGGPGFSENLDNKSVSWFIKWFERLHPEMKDILVDSEDDRFFNEIYADKAKTIVAVVNHWHVPGIKAHWRRAMGTEALGEPINPIGDMDIDAIQEANLINEALRAFYSRRTKTEPSAWGNYLTHYHKSVMEPERERHVFFGDHSDHHLSHGLFNLENGDLDHHHVEHNKTGETVAEDKREALGVNPEKKKGKRQH
jgi:hypothetical protein